MYLLFGLSTLVLLGLSIDNTSACGGRRHRPPPPCHYNQCRATYSGWAPNPADGHCVRQVQKCHHHNQRHQRNGGCPPSRNCHERDHVRTWCKCKVYNPTQWASWTQMPGQENLECKKFQRIMNYGFSRFHYAGSCNGIKGPHNPDKAIDTFCDCRHYTEAGWSDWAELSGQENQECRMSERVMKYQHSATTVEKTCPKHEHGPDKPKKDSKKTCYPCMSMGFVNKEWSAWKQTDKVEGNCVEMKRFRQQEIKQMRVQKVDGKCPDIPKPDSPVETQMQCF